MQALEGSCFVTHVSEGRPSTHGTLRCRPLVGRHNGATRISMRTLEFGSGASPLVCTGNWDEVWYIVEGQAGLWLDDTHHAVGSNTGVYLAPGRSARVENSSSNPLRVVSVRCPDPGDEVAFAPGAARTHPVPDTVPDPVPARHAVPPLVRLMDREPETTADRWYRVLVDPRLGCEQVTQFVGSIPPGRAPDHYHEYEEVLCILEGQGRMWAGTTHADVAPGSCVYLPRRQMHCVENRGEGALRLMGVFYPAGSPADARDPAVP